MALTNTTSTNCLPGGMLMPGRTYSGGSSSYRFGFNGKENDNEVKGVGNSLDFGARIYDPRVVRWLSVDPLQKKYAELSPYQFCANSPIKFVDKDGKDFGVNVNHDNKTIIITMNIYAVNEQAYKQASAALNEINSINATASVNGVTYQVKFQAAVVPSSNMSNISAQGDPIGNLYNGTSASAYVEPNKDGSLSGIGGTTESGWNVKMKKLTYADQPEKSWDMGEFSEIVGHEFLHLLGQDDKGGEFYDRKGRMNYSGSRENDFKMKNISKVDILNILKYAQQYGNSNPAKTEGDKSKVNGAQATICEEGDGNFKFEKIDNVEVTPDDKK